MSNRPSNHLVLPNEYERNKAAISNFRAYLAMYEQLNEQGLRNHEELERIEYMLQQRIMAGEEAKQQLEALRRSALRMRLTDGQPVVPDLSALAPATPPVLIPTVQVPSGSAYIEEVSGNEQRSPIIPSSSYHSHPTANNTHTSQPPYYNQQRHHIPDTASHSGAQHNPQVRRNVPPPPQQPRPSTHSAPNPNQRPQAYQGNAPVSQQPYPQTTSGVTHQSQGQAHFPVGTAPVPRPPSSHLEQHQRLVQRNDQLRQAEVPYNPRYYPSAQYSNQPSRALTPNQQAQANQNQAQVNGQQQRNTPQFGSGIGYPAQKPAWQTAGAQQQPLAVGNTAISSNPSSTVKNQGQTASSLDGALGPSSSSSVQTPAPAPSHPVAGPPQQPTPSNAPPTANAAMSAVNYYRSSAPPKVPSPVPTTNGVQQTTLAGATIQSPPASSEAGKAPTSPMRTPSQADKKHLARDLLRALKRPRPEASASSVNEPEAKRHATESAVKPAAQPTPPTSSTLPARVQTNSPFTTIPMSLVSAKPTMQVAHAAALPATPSTTVPEATQAAAPPPVASSSSTQTAVPVEPTPFSTTFQPSLLAKQTTPSTTAPTAASTQSSASTTQNALQPPITVSQAQNNPSSFTALARAQIDQATSFRPPSANQFSYANLAHVNAGALQSKPQAVADANSSKPPEPLQEAGSRVVNPPQLEKSSVVSGVEVPKAEKASVVPAVSTAAPTPVSVAESSSALTSNAASTATSGSRIAVITPKAPTLDGMAGPSTEKATPPVPSPSEKVPLFLPSPTSSPIPETNQNIKGFSPEVSQTGKVHKGKGKAISTTVLQPTMPLQKVDPKRLVFAYVLVPPLPEYAKKWKAQQRRSVQGDGLGAIDRQREGSPLVNQSRSPSLGDFPGPSDSRSPSASDVPVNNMDHAVDDEESDMEEPNAWDTGFSSYDEAEQEVLYEHCSRMRESFCRWMECDVLLNTPGALLRHLGAEHGPKRINAESPWTCQWTGCGYTVISRDDYRQHIEKHAVFPLWCPYRDCNENFRTPRQLIRHKRNNHGRDAVLRPTAQPLAVPRQSLALLSRIPKILPSYMTEYRVVRPASISKQRHEVVMASVLRRISGNVPAQLQRYNAARPMPMTPSGTHIELPVNHRYSFLEHRSTRYSSYLSTPARSRNIQDLDSAYVTDLVRKGLVLWPDKESGEAVPEAMVLELEGMEEDAVERELLEGEGYDVFGPTIAIEPAGGVGVDGERSDGPALADTTKVEVEPSEKL